MLSEKDIFELAQYWENYLQSSNDVDLRKEFIRQILADCPTKERLLYVTARLVSYLSFNARERFHAFAFFNEEHSQ